VSRICVLGNSHAAAIALGWKAVQDRYPNNSLTFFAVSNDGLAGLKPDGSALVPDTPKLAAQLGKMSGGMVRVEAAAYDVFWVCGMFFGVQPSYMLLRKYWAEFQHPDPHRTPISDPCLASTIAGALQRTLAFKLALRLTQITDRPIKIIPTPMASEALIHQKDDKRYAMIRNLVAEKKEEALSTVLLRAYRALESEQIKIIMQPEATLFSPLLSRDLYSRDSVRLTAAFDRKHPEMDFEHMNAQYGAKVIESLLAPEKAELA
jgi:hypothetical protein